MGKELSRDPHNVRQRLRYNAKRSNRAQRAERDIAILAEEGAMKPLEEWDLEELARGRPKGKNGKFNGPAPAWITPAIVAEARKRLKEKSFGDVMALAALIPKVFRGVMTDPEVDARTRLDAAKFLYEQLHGKATQAVELEARVSAAEFFADALVIEDGQGGYQPAHPIIEGEYAEPLEEAEEEKELRPIQSLEPGHRDKPRKTGTAHFEAVRDDDPPRYLE